MPLFDERIIEMADAIRKYTGRHEAAYTSGYDHWWLAEKGAPEWIIRFVERSSQDEIAALHMLSKSVALGRSSEYPAIDSSDKDLSAWLMYTPDSYQYVDRASAEMSSHASLKQRIAAGQSFERRRAFAELRQALEAFPKDELE